AAVATVGSAMPPAIIAAAIELIFQILFIFIILPLEKLFSLACALKKV
ncbi:MAG: hypothetical protein ACI9U1_001755, partial [Porticoccaceae bacterium]